ncbi:MAG: DUF3341 domain-containing protein [Saprospiraceae bacterium]
MSKSQDILYGIYNDEVILMDAIRKANDTGLEIAEVYTPFPVHGLDDVLGLEESRLHIAGFVYGILGTMTAFGVMTWVFTRDWPIIFGGKPYFSAPAFIPITFELTVLFACVGMVITFYTICGLGPGVVSPVVDDRLTDDKFCIQFNVNGSSDINGLKSFLTSTGAEEVNTKTI